MSEQRLPYLLVTLVIAISLVVSQTLHWNGSALLSNINPVALPAILTESPCISNQYKVVSNIDECMLNQLGVQGWQVVQAGAATDRLGLDAGCIRANTYVVDWILMSRASLSHTCFPGQAAPITN